ncbi:MAG: hypothetical protein MI923_15530 [Phycisphaerales bacterium]|nr:hypothetical protein [Phycisphaerales bacterium]
MLSMRSGIYVLRGCPSFARKQEERVFRIVSVGGYLLGSGPRAGVPGALVISLAIPQGGIEPRTRPLYKNGAGATSRHPAGEKGREAPSRTLKGHLPPTDTDHLLSSIDRRLC